MAARAAAASKPAPNGTKPDYGIDSPHLVRSMFSRAGWTLAVALAIWVVNHNEYPGPAAELFALFAVIAVLFFAAGWYMRWSSLIGKLQKRDQLLDALGLRGDERILDAGCGLGLIAIGAAKRLKTGKVTAVDTWNPRDLSGNSIEAARNNAKLEGIGDRVRFETGDLRKLVYPESHFDVVLSSNAIHHMPDEDDRDHSVREMYRVLKPEGKLLIFDSLYTGRYAKILKESGAADVTLSPHSFLWCMPNRIVTARKSSTT